jgi:2-polyprenyl-3-methyl-5-hydroxy-6-metoxy-1,4-benzoquinol methylase
MWQRCSRIPPGTPAAKGAAAMNFLDRILYPGIENVSDNGIPERTLITDLEHLPKEQQCYFRPYEWAGQQLKGLDVLDVCCGIGAAANYFAKFARRIKGIDNSHVAIRFAKDRFERIGLEFDIADATDLHYPRESFDAVTFIEAVEHFTAYDQQLVLSEIYRVLKPNGKVFFSTPNRELTMGNNVYHLKELNQEQLRLLMGMYFKNIVIKGVTFDGVVHGEPDGCPILFGRCEK